MAVFTGGTNPVEQSTGQRLLSEADLEKIAGQLTLVQRWVQSREENFIFFLAPNKETIYREKLPESETVVTDETEAFQLINYLKEHTDISVVWPYEELMEAKADSGMWIYSKLDTHWEIPELISVQKRWQRSWKWKCRSFGSVCRAIGDFPWRSCKYVKCQHSEWG